MKNREIKFRGLNQSNELVYGDLIYGVGSKSGNVYILPRVINLAKIKHCDPLDGVKVNPESVGQFTGLHDKNGKEIYEGDVITYIDYDLYHEDEYLNKGVVEYYADEMKFTISNRNTVEIESIDFKKEVEVIGNVFENPELLSDKN